MKFEEIFKEEGLYVADSFAKGFAFKITKSKIDSSLIISTLTYDYDDDMNPVEEDLIVYGGLFNKDYKMVSTRQSLFNI